MNLYNVLLNNKIPFVLHESGDSENVIYCKSSSDYLFNVGTFVTKTKEVILEYVVENGEKYVSVDVTFDNGECYENVRFKIVVNENTETPYSTINLNLLNNKTQVAIPQQSQQIVEDAEELVQEPAPVHILTPIIEAPDYTETINETLKLQKKLNVEKEEIRKQKIVLEKQNLLNKKLQEYKQELLEEYVTAVDKQKQLLGAHLKETLTIAEHDLSERITNTFNEYNNQLEIYQNKSKADQLEFIIEKINDSIVDIKVDLNSLVSNKFNQEQDILLEALHAKSQLLQEKYEQKLLLELEKYKETLFEEFRLSSQEAIVQTLAQKKDLTEQQIIIAFDNKEKEFNSHFEARIKNTTLELDSIIQEFSNKLPVISNDISLLETRLKDLLEERKKSDETGKFNTSQQKYITDTAQYWARRILDLGGGGGSVAVQYANGGTMNGDLNVNANYLSGGVNLLDIFALQPDLDHQTLSFNESTAQLSISNGNTVSLSALSGEFTDRLVNGSYQAVLSGNGNLTLPGAIVTASNSKLDLVGYGPNTAYLTTTADDSTALYMATDVAELRANTTVSITTNTGGTPHLWEFGTDGGLKFPDNTTQTTAFTGNPDSSNWDSTYTTVKNFSASWEESAEIIPTVTNYLSTNNIVLSSATITDYLSTDTIYSSGTVGVISDNINEAGNGENTLTLAFQNGIFIENNLTSFGVISTGGGTSNNWNSTHTVLCASSANWNDAVYNVIGTANEITAVTTGTGQIDKTVILSLPSEIIAPGNLTVLGNLTALGTSTFKNTVFTTTSALSVVNLGPGPALYVFQASGPYDVASFYDGDGIEVLHVGNAQGGGNPLGQVGVNTGDPSAELTVNGAISSNGAITVFGGNSNQWNTAYTNLVSNSSNYLSGASVSYVNTNFVKISGDTMTGALSTTVLSAGDIFVQGRTRITSRNVTNIFIGDNTTGSVNAAGNHNFVFGNNAGILLAAGSHNNFLGRAAGLSNTTGSHNNFFGNYAGRNNTYGGNNNFLGRYAGFTNTTGSHNNFLGICAGHQIGKYGGSHNIFIGYKAGKGSYDSGRSPVGTGCSVSRNVAIGFKAGYSLRACGYDGCCYRYGYAATDNIFIGYEAGFSARESARHNNFFGNCAGRDNTSGGSNNFLGNCAGRSNTSGNDNNFLGRAAGQCNTYGGNNNFLGSYAGFSNTSGIRNNFLGRAAGFNNTSGNDNNFFGYFTGAGNTTGCHNNFLGNFAGAGNTTGRYNNFLGNGAGRCNTTGRYNNFLGSYAGRCNTTGCHNNFFGNCAGTNNTSGNDNNFLGRRAGCTNTIGSNNIIVGNAANVATNSLSGVIVLGTGAIATQTNQIVLSSADISLRTLRGTAAGPNVFIGNSTTGNNNATGNHNFVFGLSAGNALTTGCNNSFIGNCAGRLNCSGSSNNFFGSNAGLCNTCGCNNNFLGYKAGRCNTCGCSNNFLGCNAGYGNSCGCNNNFFGCGAGSSSGNACNNNLFGYSAGSNSCGCNNNFMGCAAGCCNGTGCLNNFFGCGAGKGACCSNNNTFIGNKAGSYASLSVNNNFLGQYAGCGSCRGNGNNFLGASAGRSNTSGSYNNFLGREAGCTNTIGSNNIIVGNAANVATNSLSGVIVLGTGAIATQSHALVIGSGTPPLSGLIRGNLHLTHSLSASNIALGGASVIVPTSTTDNGQFVIININGTNKAIRLWDYTA